MTTRGDVPTTNFALPLTVAQSFNRSLWHANGARIGRTPPPARVLLLH